MGFVPPFAPPPALNVDRFGLPRDYATYMWLVYRQRVDDRSPQRTAFDARSASDLIRADMTDTLRRLYLPSPDPELLGEVAR